MDGTVYLGDHLFKGAKETFEYFKQNDISFVFLTNNSSHSLPFYVAKIKKMGIDCNEDNFYSSIETTIRYLEERHIKTIYVLGVETFKNELKKHFNVLDHYDEKVVPEVVLASFDRRSRWGRPFLWGCCRGRPPPASPRRSWRSPPG